MFNKRGWLRIMEAVISILILSSVLIVLYVNNTPQVSSSDIVYEMQVRILDDIGSSDVLRNETLKSNETYISPVLVSFVDSKISNDYNFSIKVCSLSNLNCALNYPWPGEIYAEDRIVGGNLYSKDSKLIRLYVWLEKRG